MFCLNSGKRDQSPQRQGPGRVKLSQQRIHNPTQTLTYTLKHKVEHRCTDASSGNALDSCRSEAIVRETRCLAVIHTSLKRQAQRSAAVQSHCNIMRFFLQDAHNFSCTCRRELQIRSLNLYILFSGQQSWSKKSLESKIYTNFSIRRILQKCHYLSYAIYRLFVTVV